MVERKVIPKIDIRSCISSMHAHETVDFQILTLIIPNFETTLTLDISHLDKLFDIKKY